MKSYQVWYEENFRRSVNWVYNGAERTRINGHGIDPHVLPMNVLYLEHLIIHNHLKYWLFWQEYLIFLIIKLTTGFLFLIKENLLMVHIAWYTPLFLFIISRLWYSNPSWAWFSLLSICFRREKFALISLILILMSNEHLFLKVFNVQTTEWPAPFYVKFAIRG